MNTTREGRILGVVSLIVSLALLGGLYLMTKDGTPDLDPQCLEENRKMESGPLELKPKLKDCRKETMNKERK